MNETKTYSASEALEIVSKDETKVARHWDFRSHFVGLNSDGDLVDFEIDPFGRLIEDDYHHGYADLLPGITWLILDRSSLLTSKEKA